MEDRIPEGTTACASRELRRMNSIEGCWPLKGRTLAHRSQRIHSVESRPDSVFEDDAGLGERCGVSKGKGGAGDAEAGGDLGCAAMESEGGPAGELADNLEFEPGDAEADAGAEGLGAGFFGGKAGGKALGGFALAQAVCLFRGGIDTIEEAGPVTLDGAMDAVNLDQVDAGADDHASFQTTKLHDEGRGAAGILGAWVPAMKEL